MARGVRLFYFSSRVHEKKKKNETENENETKPQKQNKTKQNQVKSLSPITRIIHESPLPVSVLPKGWADYAARVQPHSGTMYGSHFWRRTLYKADVCQPDQEKLKARLAAEVPNWPEDAYLASGYAGQVVMVIPSQDMVLVRLGYTPVGLDFNSYKFMMLILESLRE